MPEVVESGEVTADFDMSETSSEDEGRKSQAQVDLLDLIPIDCHYKDCVQSPPTKSFEFSKNNPINVDFSDLGIEQLHQLMQWSEQVADNLNTIYINLNKTLQNEWQAKEKLLDELIAKSTDSEELRLFK
ncbi:hypothetical protein DASB73_024910 [Starmerella bacillaris]|uniref:Uncharacterized protein n=1 Tax=Starmerella bacillaris TaxID=1247836 RepID=A0AAV5RJ77_STABA|nr:hypothetical protein DASB73_024910 [Starmerella bacillaris]